MTGGSGCLLLQLLALFRFVVLLLGYAVVRLRHWWVIAVRRGSDLSWGGVSLSSWPSQGSELCPTCFSGHYTGIQCLPDREGHPL